MSVKPIPEGYASVTPYIIVDGAAAAIEFYKQAFGATERMRLEQPDGKMAHAEINIGNSIVMLADEFPDHDIRGPKSIGDSPTHFMIYVENVDDAFATALAAGATEVRPLVDQFYGDRSGMVEDPYGHRWTIATHVADVPPEEIQRHMEAMAEGDEG